MGCNDKTKLEIAREVLRNYSSKGGFPNLHLQGVPVKIQPRSQPKKRMKNVAATAVATGVEMMKDTLASTLSKNAILSKGVVPRAVSALAAASESMINIKESVRSNERNAKKRST